MKYPGGLQSKFASEKSQVISTTPLQPSVSESGVASNIRRTMDDYSTALRMTLATRKELRDQKKVAKFWKRKALDDGQVRGVITPSVSNISSIHEPLPAERQMALDALISQRGLISRLSQIPSQRDSIPLQPISASEPTSEQADISGDAVHALPSFSLEASGSRLGPLASESLKAEINVLFGAQDSVKRPSALRKLRADFEHAPSLVDRLIGASYMTSTPSKKSNLSFNIESFGDLNMIFETTFGVSDLLQEENASFAPRNVENSSTKSRPPNPLGNVQATVPSRLPYSISSGFSGSSEISEKDIPTPLKATANAPSVAASASRLHSLKQASKECTSRRSWQRYRVQPTALKHTSRTQDSIARNTHPSSRVKSGKENSYVMTIPAFKSKKSRLPVAARTKSGDLEYAAHHGS
ncbi:hypothetical protein B0H34DRAFT_308027 [Crassisporium funariophilum]|nr:hypothetical protein B0H34DRAFT_308027 [Crassisporium funariophilum]